MAIPAVLAAILKPLLGNGLNLVGNAVLAKGKDWVEKKLGVELKPDMTADEIIRLKQAEMEHEEELLKLKLEYDKLDLQQLDMIFKDTSDARDREIKIATAEAAPLLNKIVTPVLALSVIALTFILFAVVMFDSSPVEPSRKDILVYVLGAFGVSIVTQVSKKLLSLENDKKVILLFTAVSFIFSGIEYLSTASGLPPTILGVSTVTLMGIATPIYHWIVKPANVFISQVRAYRSQIEAKAAEVQALQSTAVSPPLDVHGKSTNKLADYSSSVTADPTQATPTVLTPPRTVDF